MSTSAVPREFIEHEAPIRYGERRCSMKYECKTYEQTARWGAPEVGKVRTTKDPVGTAFDDTSIVLCGLCERAWIDSEKSVYEFTGIKKKGKVVSYYLPYLRRIRRAQGITQRELAYLAECSTQTIEDAERAGNRREKVSTKMAGKLARALGVQTSELRGE